ncbi:DUF4352 domain-containing protein [Patescibacteria group bacterium]|nr:DUF4352 domain-containing protein [Patescibacteria group bacterium]MBU2579881.1 DUF4352 domain-containing protein [Patescibacteria group bacterium]
MNEEKKKSENLSKQEEIEMEEKMRVEARVKAEKEIKKKEQEKQGYGCLAVLGLIVFVIVIIIFIDGDGSKKKETTQSLAPEKSQIITVYLKKEAWLKNCKIIAYGISKHQESDSWRQPSLGNKYIAIDIELTNITDNPKYYSTYDFELYDNQGHIYERSIYEKEPKFESIELAPTRKMRGYITYEVPNNINLDTLELVYLDDSWLSSDFETVVIKLEER